MFPFQPPPRKQERGQVLVMVAVLLVILVGFAGVAIDGGNLYTEQRRAQAAADNAVLAAAFAQMKGTSDTPTLRTTALDNAKVNAYNNNQTDNWVSFYRPPLHGGHAGDRNYMEVVITRSVQTALVHFVYRQNPVAVTVFAVAHGKYSEPVMAGFAIAAFHPTCDADLFSARGDVVSIIKDGGIYVNAPPTDSSGQPCNSIGLSGGNARVATTRSSVCPDDSIPMGQPGGCTIDGSFPIQVSGAQLEGTTCSASPDWWSNPGTNCNFYPGVQTGASQMPPTSYESLMPVTVADVEALCPSNGTASGSSSSRHLTPGKFFSGMQAYFGDDVTLDPGVYCVYGTGPAGKVLDFTSLTGHGVLIYLADPTGEFSYTGNGSLDISAPFNGENGLNCANTPASPLCDMQGIVLFKPNGPDTCDPNDTDVDFAGRAPMIVRGLIWAPKSFFRYSGQGNLYMSGQALAGCARYAGNGEMDITYNPDDSFVPPPSVQLDN